MTPGIKFHKGSRILKLHKTEIDDAIEFPEDVKFKAKEERIFFKTFIDDVFRFDEKVHLSTNSINDSASESIASWILKEAAQKSISVYSPEEKIGNLKTAVVHCNFTDISRMIQSFRMKLMELGSDEMEIRDILVTENDAIHEILKIIEEKNTSPQCLSVIIIRQFESLRPHFLDSLISLIYSTETCRHLVPRIRLIVCMSTSSVFLKQNCEMETINMMELKEFKFTEVEEIFSKIIATGMHSHFQPPRPRPKNIDEDDPTLLGQFDCAPGVFSGPFMQYLKNRFFACDYSVSALSRAIQFAILQKYLKDPLWRQETHHEELTKYDRVLEIFLKEFGENSKNFDLEFIKIHMEIQSDVNFWTEIRKESIFMQRKQALFESVEKSMLLAFCDRLAAETALIDTIFTEKLRNLREKLEFVELPTIKPTQNEQKMENTPVKMSAMDLRRQHKAAMSAKQNNPISQAKSAIFAHIMNLFETTLRPYPSSWRNVIGMEMRNGDTTDTAKISLDSSDEFDIENTLLNHKSYEKMPLAVAWRSLLCHRNFKSVPLNDWAEQFLNNIKMPKSEAKGAFFAAVSLLEHIGLIRGAADKNSRNVLVLYHPVSFIPNI